MYLGACFDLRINEVCALQVRDFDLDRKVLHVRHSVGKGEGDKGYRRLKETKTESSTADLPIPDALVPMIREQINGRGGDKMLIESPKTGGILTDSALRRLFNRAAEVAGRPDLHFHTLRATAIDAATHQGATLKETMALGRHDDERTSIARYQRAGSGAVCGSCRTPWLRRCCHGKGLVRMWNGSWPRHEKRLAQLEAS